jgi:hypothetical protein
MEYATVEMILADLHRVGPGRMKAFRSQLRVLRDKGIPVIEKPGKGTRVTYNFENLWDMHFALCLDAFGLPPQRIHMVTENVGKRMIPVIERLEAECGEDIWCQVYGAVMEALGMHPTDKDEVIMAVSLGPLNKFVEEMRKEERPKGTSARLFGLLNLSEVSRDVYSEIKKHSASRRN